MVARGALLGLAVVGCTLLVGCSRGGEIATPSTLASIDRSPSILIPTQDSTPATPAKSTSPTAETAEGGGATTNSNFNASAVITIAAVSSLDGTVIFGGYVTGLVESSGACTFNVTDASGSSVAVATSTGVANSGTTSCGSPALSAGTIESGAYSVTLTYSNDRGSTTSDPVELDIP